MTEARLALFAYGSLVDPASGEQTLGRPVVIAARGRLEGWRRGWTVARDNLSSEKTFSRPDGSLPRFILSLDIEPNDEGVGPNGALIAVTAEELERLDLRELRHRRVDVTGSVRPAVPEGAAAAEAFDRIYAYRARPQHHHPTPSDDAIVIAAYLETVEAAFAALGRRELELFRSTTTAPPVPVSDATLVRDRIPAGNPRRW